MDDYVLFQVGEDAYIKFSGLIKCYGAMGVTAETMGLFCVYAAHFENCEYYGDFSCGYINDEDGELKPIIETITADVNTLLSKMDDNGLASIEAYTSKGGAIAGYTALKDLWFSNVVVEDTTVINWSSGNSLTKEIFKGYRNYINPKYMYHYHTGKNLYIKSVIERIEEDAFLANYDIENITYDKPEKLTYIGSGAFDGCYNLKTFSNNNNIYGFVGAYAFYECGAIQQINLEKTAIIENYNEFGLQLGAGTESAKNWEEYGWDVNERHKVKTTITDKSGYLSIYDWSKSGRICIDEAEIELAFRCKKDMPVEKIKAYYRSKGFRSIRNYYDKNKPIVFKYEGKIYFIDNALEIYKIHYGEISRIVTRADNELVVIL